MRVLGAASLVLLAWVGSGLRAQTWPPTIVILMIAGIVTMLAFRRPVGRLTGPDAARVPHPLRRSTLVWGVLLAVGLLWEAYAFFHQPSPLTPSFTHPTLSTLFDPFLEYRPVRFTGWLLWFWAGRSLVRL